MSRQPPSRPLNHQLSRVTIKTLTTEAIDYCANLKGQIPSHNHTPQAGPIAKSGKVSLYFLLPIAGVLDRELAVADTFGFSFFGFLVSFLLFLPLAIVCPFKLQWSDAEASYKRLHLSFIYSKI